MLTTLRRTLRSLKRSPIYFTTATLSLALGLGLSTASFLFIDSLEHPQVPYADVDRLDFANLRLGNQRTPPSLAELQRSLARLPAIAQTAILSGKSENVTINGDETGHLVTRASPNFFELIGIRATLGRMPNAEEIRTASAALVTQDIWKRIYGGAKEIGNARMEVEGKLVNVVGVLPRGADLSFPGDIWLPFEAESDLESLTQFGSTVAASAQFGSALVVVKLRRHQSDAAVNTQLASAASDLTQRFVAAGSHAPSYDLQLRSVRPRPMRTDEFGILMIVIGIGVLIIAATNVAALALARGLTRKRDYALRIALGASRGAIAGEVLTEIGVIALVGAVGGVMAALAMIGALTRIVPEEMAAHWYVVPAFSTRLFGFAAAALIGAIVVAGAIPAWRASRVSPADPLKESAGTTTGRSRQEFRLLVVGELAVSMVLLMLASLMSLSVRNVASYKFGYDARPLLQANVYFRSVKDTSENSARVAARQASLDRIRATDGVLSAATMNGVSVPDWQMISEAMTPADQPMSVATATNVSAGFFHTLGVPLAEGRDFEEGDRANGGAVILSPRAARILFPRGGGVGRMVRWGGEHSTRWLRVVGISNEFEMYFRNPDGRDPDPPVFVSTNQRFFDGWGILIRPRNNDPKLALALHAVLRDALPPKASAQVRPWLDNYELQIRGTAFFADLFGFIATAAMLLGAAGLFSVLSYAVSQRMREFAVRSALGAQRRDILVVVLKYALEMSLAGTAIGALLSFWASTGVSAFLFGVKNTDPVSLVVAELTLLAITMGAALIPAIRATRADPVEVLRAS
jgi:putative ABC transport system permease protein